MLNLPITQPRLNREEWSVVRLALREAEQAFRAIPAAPGTIRAKWQWLLRAATGIEPVHGLANPRLEALRRFILTTRRSRRIAEQLVPELLSEGFNRAEVEAIALLAA
jgi:hypothetical protein